MRRTRTATAPLLALAGRLRGRHAHGCRPRAGEAAAGGNV